MSNPSGADLAAELMGPLRATVVVPPSNVYQLIAAVSGELAIEGIAKSRQNTQQKFSFRGIDDVYNALAPVLARHGLVILPRMLSREVVERKSNSGGALFSVTVAAEFDFVSSHDGSRHTVRIYGEAMDSGDKATNKAMSAAYKYAAFQAFCIPTEGDNDADKTTHEVAAAAPEGFELWAHDLEIVAEQGTGALYAAWKGDGDGKAFEERRNHMMATNRAGWERIKAKAAQASARIAEAVAAAAANVEAVS